MENILKPNQTDLIKENFLKIPCIFSLGLDSPFDFCFEFLVFIFKIYSFLIFLFIIV